MMEETIYRLEIISPDNRGERFFRSREDIRAYFDLHIHSQLVEMGLADKPGYEDQAATIQFLLRELMLVDALGIRCEFLTLVKQVYERKEVITSMLDQVRLYGEAGWGFTIDPVILISQVARKRAREDETDDDDPSKRMRTV